MREVIPGTIKKLSEGDVFYSDAITKSDVLLTFFPGCMRNYSSSVSSAKAATVNTVFVSSALSTAI